MIENILAYFDDTLHSVFETMDVNILYRISEIRIRRNQYLMIVIRNTSYFMDDNADLYDTPHNRCLITDNEQFDRIFMAVCSYSLYSNTDSLIKGYITLPCGARVGVASSAVTETEQVISVKNAVSLNFRIPHAVKECSENLLNFLYINSFPSVIVAGQPNSGKTTLLRDMARKLSSGFNGKYRKVTIVDERNEFAGKENQTFTLDVGVNTDVLTGFSKAQGIEIATRTLSPELIICDEISTENEAKSILYGFSTGVRFALSLHIASREDLLYKPIVKMLLAQGEFSYIILLDHYSYHYEILDASEVYDEICRRSRSDYGGNADRLLPVG